MLHKIDFSGFEIWKILDRVISDILFVSLVPGIRLGNGLLMSLILELWKYERNS
jgi:hypothetical protein